MAPTQSWRFLEFSLHSGNTQAASQPVAPVHRAAVINLLNTFAANFIHKIIGSPFRIPKHGFFFISMTCVVGEDATPVWAARGGEGLSCGARVRSLYIHTQELVCAEKEGNTALSSKRMESA